MYPKRDERCPVDPWKTAGGGVQLSRQPIPRRLVTADDAILPARLRLPAAVIAVGATTVLLALTWWFWGAASADAGEASLTSALGRWLEPADGILDDVEDPGDAGSPVATCIALATVLAAMRQRRLAVLALLGPATAGTLSVVLKPMIGRLLDGDPSFPSGHVTAITSVAVVVSLVVLRHHRGRVAALLAATAVVACAALMGTAVVAAGVHYPTDVMGGFALAVASVLGMAFLLDAVLGWRTASGSTSPTTRSASSRLRV